MRQYFNYLIIPLELTNKLTYHAIAVLSQLIYMKKAFNELNPSNAYLSKKLNLSVPTIKRAIKELSNSNYITMELKDNYKREITITNKSFKAYGILTIKKYKKPLETKKSPLKEFLEN